MKEEPSPAPWHARRDASKPRAEVPSFWTRLEIFRLRCNPNYCESFRRESSKGLVACNRYTLTYDWSLQPIMIWQHWFPVSGFEVTSIIGSMYFRSSFHR